LSNIKQGNFPFEQKNKNALCKTTEKMGVFFKNKRIGTKNHGTVIKGDMAL
jgi:hypothetical protein